MVTDPTIESRVAELEYRLNTHRHTGFDNTPELDLGGGDAVVVTPESEHFNAGYYLHEQHYQFAAINAANIDTDTIGPGVFAQAAIGADGLAISTQNARVWVSKRVGRNDAWAKDISFSTTFSQETNIGVGVQYAVMGEYPLGTVSTIQFGDQYFGFKMVGITAVSTTPFDFYICTKKSGAVEVTTLIPAGAVPGFPTYRSTYVLQASYSAATGECTFYINGVLVGTVSGANALVNNPALFSTYHQHLHYTQNTVGTSDSCSFTVLHDIVKRNYT